MVSATADEMPLIALSAIKENVSSGFCKPPGWVTTDGVSSTASKQIVRSYSVRSIDSGSSMSAVTSSAYVWGNGQVTMIASALSAEPSSILTCHLLVAPRAIENASVLHRTSSPWAKCFAISVMPRTPRYRGKPSLFWAVLLKPRHHSVTTPDSIHFSTCDLKTESRTVKNCAP